MKARPQGATTLLLLGVLACASPQSDPPADVANADTLDTYVEGSRRVWDAARDRGVTFRAVGQEPGWLLEIDETTVTLITDYGADTVVVPAPRPVTDEAERTTVYRAIAQQNDVVVTIREEPCTDTMSGERFSRSVGVVLNGRELSGCGRNLDQDA